MYYFDIILLEGCSSSSDAYNLLVNNQINHKKVIVNNNNKHLYKSKDIDTYPQIYLKKYNHNGNVLIGGYDNLSNLFKLFHGKELNDKHISNVMNEYNISKKASLRIFELINSKYTLH